MLPQLTTTGTWEAVYWEQLTFDDLGYRFIERLEFRHGGGSLCRRLQVTA